ncbi:hypothetical protein OG863_07450 [Streptomyces decoyicus]|uniref:Endonuclease n=1 Tax=Streptomyces decoyicus TaxID=249567 RepID=A0ABZ1FBT9_9ACTN|nr:hypothetical protein [Streptomyces decoyicus]WSB67807.1 hypothetical protein OG863_07450 [Streptomyces decoyicus]
MPHSALRTSRIAVLATALAAVTVTVAPSASAADSPRLKVLSYNVFLIGNIG